MKDNDRILLLDDEETFLYSTQALLTKAGYHCDTALDGATANSLIHEGAYDLLIADICVSGNCQLELVRELSTTRPDLPVLLATGYPSLQTAVESIDLPVAAYLIKPFEFADLLRHVSTVLARKRLRIGLQAAKESAEAWSRHFDLWEDFAQLGWRENHQISGFLAKTVEHVELSLRTMVRLTQAMTESAGQGDGVPCHLLNCPRGTLFEELLRETVEELERTKHAFKSKNLGELRRRIEIALRGDRPTTREDGGVRARNGRGKDFCAPNACEQPVEFAEAAILGRPHQDFSKGRRIAADE